MASRAMLSLVDSAPDQRAADRVRLLLSARLLTTSDAYAVTLRDISTTGAMVEATQLPGVGIDVILKRGELEIFSTIVWVSGRRAGLEFDTPLGVEEFVTKFARTAWAPQAPAPIRMPRSTPAPAPLNIAEWEAAKSVGMTADRN